MAAKGLTWPKFMSQYSKEHPKSTKKQISTAWSAYKKQHGIVPAAKVKKAKGTAPPRKAVGKKNGKEEKKTHADKKITNSEDIGKGSKHGKSSPKEASKSKTHGKSSPKTSPKEESKSKTHTHHKSKASPKSKSKTSPKV